MRNLRILAWVALLVGLTLPAAGCSKGTGTGGRRLGSPKTFSAAAPAQQAGTSQPAPSAVPVVPAALHVQDGQFKDAQGRTVILRGVNVADASKRAPFLPWQDESKFDLMQAWGMNCIRYLISWEAIEPKPGQYDRAYLDEVAKRIKWARDRGIYVFLDMHQDLFAHKYYPEGNGAPEWACLDKFRLSKWIKNVPWHLHSWDPGVVGAFEAFWRDAKPMGEAKGIQTHYVDAWKVVAERFKGEPNVIGFDIMNEPLYGYRAYTIFLHGARFQLTLLWQHIWPWIMTPKYMMELVRKEMFDNKKLYGYQDAMAPGFEEFDTKILGPFMQRVINEVRPIAPQWIAFVEPGMLKDGGAKAFLHDLKDPAGRPLKNLCYAAHYYDPTMMWVDPYDGNQARGEIAFDRIRDEAKRLDAAVLLGEWGGIETPGNAERHIIDQLDLIEGYAYGATWWDYRPRLETESWLPAFVRPYPSALAGTLDEYSFDPRTKRFTILWKENLATSSHVTEIFVPKVFNYPNGFVVDSWTDPAGSWTWSWDAKTLTLSITPDPNTPDHTFYIDPK